MKYVDYKFCSHICAIGIALIYAYFKSAGLDTVTLGNHTVDAFTAAFVMYMMFWFLLGGVIEFIKDLASPIIKYFNR